MESTEERGAGAAPQGGKWRIALAALGGVAAAWSAVVRSSPGGSAGQGVDDLDPLTDGLDLTAASPGRRLSTSTKCRKALEAMLTNEHWNAVNDSYTRWCRIKAENEMAKCCRIADFAAGRGEGCGDCSTICQYSRMERLCNSYLDGTACNVDRKLFEAAPIRVTETICVPDDCNNGADRDAFIAWFATLYAGRLAGWHANWDDALLTCPSVAVLATIYTALGLGIAGLLVAMSAFLFISPPERGKTLVTQADMQAQADREEAEAMGDLRGAAMGADPSLGQSFTQTGTSR